MEEFKGTKGDWKLVTLETTQYHIARNEIQFGNDGECVAEFVHNDYDAKLIAAAPELLKALLEVKEILEKEWPENEWDVFANEETSLNEAINKALN